MTAVTGLNLDVALFAGLFHCAQFKFHKFWDSASDITDGQSLTFKKNKT